MMSAGVTVVRSGPVCWSQGGWNGWPAATASFIGGSSTCAGCTGRTSETGAFAWKVAAPSVSLYVTEIKFDLLHL